MQEQEQQHQQFHQPPPTTISPAFTPPSTPGTHTPSSHVHTPQQHPSDRDAAHIPIDAASFSRLPEPSLLPALPTVRCEVRARIPTTAGTDMWLHLYSNDADGKEHLAIVFGETVRSRSLDAVREGETERDRLIRGAYMGRLFPGRLRSTNELELEQQSQEQEQKSDQSQHQNQNQDRRRGSKESTETSMATATTTPIRSKTTTTASITTTTTTTTTKAPMVRIHSECYTGETVWSARCDCGEQLDEAARLMSLPGNAAAGGVIIYLRQEGRGIGLGEKLKAYNLQDLGHDTYEANLLLRHPADARSYGLATAMLVDLGLGGDRGIRLLTNNPEKIKAVEGPGREIRVKERVAMVPLAWKRGGKGSVEVEKYLETKIAKFKHLLG